MCETCKCVEWAWLDGNRYWSRARMKLNESHANKKITCNRQFSTPFSSLSTVDSFPGANKYNQGWVPLIYLCGAVCLGPEREFSLRFPLSWYHFLRVSSNHVISKIFSLVPEVKSAEKLLHEHEVETTTSFIMYYSYGVGKGKSKVRGASDELWVCNSLTLLLLLLLFFFGKKLEKME